MLKSHEKFHSANGKRQVLIVDDEFVNRAFDAATKICLAADFDEKAFDDDLPACVERMNAIPHATFVASPIYQLRLSITPFPGRPDICLVTATGCQGVSEGA